jgi:MFS family permease
LKRLPARPFGVLLGATLLSVAGDGITQVGVACGPLNPITTRITYELTPEHMRGRAIGTMTATALVATPFGALPPGR